MATTKRGPQDWGFQSYCQYVSAMLNPALSTTEAGWLLGVSGDIVREYIKGGDLVAFRLPGKQGRWRIKLSEVLSFVEAGS